MEVISINNQYASGLRRLGAFLIDGIIISTVTSILFRIIFGWGDFPFINGWDYYWNGAHFSLFPFPGVFHQLILIAYYALMESSKYQGTLGKIVLGMRVVGIHNERISLGKAILRNLSKIISAAILLIGYIMIIFDNRKQGLHDKIADTFVVRN